MNINISLLILFLCFLAFGHSNEIQAEETLIDTMSKNSKETAKDSSINSHQNIETEIKNFQCGKCERSFNSKPRLEFHKKVTQHIEPEESFSNEISNMLNEIEDEEIVDNLKTMLKSSQGNTF